jgi:hypothetical protein
MLWSKKKQIGLFVCLFVCLMVFNATYKFDTFPSMVNV